MSTNRHLLGGATMGTRWSVELHAGHPDLTALQNALQNAVEEVDAQMSTWRPSDLMRLNQTPVGEWVHLPARLMCVLERALAIGRESNGAFDIALGDAVTAWGFNDAPADLPSIQAARVKPRQPAHLGLELDLASGRARRLADQSYDLSGIAKGYGVDRLAEVLTDFAVQNALAAIDGELRAIGPRHDGTDWPIVVERPDYDARTAHAMLSLRDGAVATSGDYRHWVNAAGRQLSHTMDPKIGAPLLAPPASVTVLAPTCMQADALATVLMVLGATQGQAFAEKHQINALFLLREGDTLREITAGPIFA